MFYEKMKATQNWPDMSECGDECALSAEDIAEIFTLARANIAGDVSCDTDLSQVYKIAMQAERDSIEFYRKNLQAATDPNAQLFYQTLLGAERKHLQLVAKTEEYLNDTEQWYFDEEQWIVEG